MKHFLALLGLLLTCTMGFSQTISAESTNTDYQYEGILLENIPGFDYALTTHVEFRFDYENPTTYYARADAYVDGGGSTVTSYISQNSSETIPDGSASGSVSFSVSNGYPTGLSSVFGSVTAYGEGYGSYALATLQITPWE